MIYMVEVEVRAIRRVYVDAATIEEAERLGCKEVESLVGGVDGSVLSVYSGPELSNQKNGD